MFQRILVPLDGSAQAERAIPVASRLARVAGGTLVFVHVVLPPSEFGEYSAPEEAMAVQPSIYEKRVTKAEQYLQQVIHNYASDLGGIHIEQEVEPGTPAPAIFSTAHLEDVDLMVLWSHGAHNLFHWIFKSVAREAVHHSPVPMLILREANTFLDSLQVQPLRVLVTLDGSPFAEAALQPALQLLTALAAPGQGEMHLVHVIDLPSVERKPLLRSYEIKRQQDRAIQEAEGYLQGVAHRLSEALPAETRPSVTWSVMVSNHVARTIARMVTSVEGKEQGHGYDLLAMATHGRAGVQLLRLGSVTEHMLGTTRLPLLVVRPLQSAGQQTPREEIRETAKR